MIRRKRELFNFSAILLLCSLPWALPWIDECSTQEFITDSESSFKIQACSVDELELRLNLINTADVLGELICSDNKKRVLTHYETVYPGLTGVKFAIDPPLVESSRCSVIICYEDTYYDPYYIHTSPSLQYNDCVPSLVDIEVSLNHSATEDSLFSNFVTAELSYSSDVISVPSVVTTTPGYRPSTPITGSSLPSSASVLTQNLQITHTTESSNPTTHSDSHTTKLKNNSNLAISSLAQTSMYITSSQINSTTNSTSATNTNYLTSPVIKEPALQGGISENLILVVSIPLSVTCLVAMATILFCILRIAFQRSYKRKLADSQADSSSSFYCRDSKEHFELSSSPSICTIISPLSSMDDSESIISERVERPCTYGAYSCSVDTYSDSYVLNDSSRSIGATNSLVLNCSDPVIQWIVPSIDLSNSGDNVSFSIESISLGSLEALPGRFLPYEDRRQAVDHRNSDRWERDSYIYIVDNYEII